MRTPNLLKLPYCGLLISDLLTELLKLYSFLKFSQETEKLPKDFFLVLLLVHKMCNMLTDKTKNVLIFMYSTSIYHTYNIIWEISTDTQQYKCREELTKGHDDQIIQDKHL